MSNDQRDASEVFGLEIWIICCESCGFEDAIYDLTDMGSYGRTLGRTCLGELTELSLTQTPVYEELIKLLREVMGSVDLHLFLQCRERLFGLIVDSAPSGERYTFIGPPCCRRCRGQARQVRWGEPADVAWPTPLPLATSHEWDKLSREGKIELIQGALRSWELL